MKKYWEKKEIFITMNLVVIAFIGEGLRLYGAETDQWFYGQHLSIVKLSKYLYYLSCIFVREFISRLILSIHLYIGDEHIWDEEI